MWREKWYDSGIIKIWPIFLLSKASLNEIDVSEKN